MSEEKNYTWNGYYNYYECLKDDVTDYIECNINFADYDDIDQLRDCLNEDLFCADSVTGNGSGSYTFSTYEAEENICHNLDLLGEALEEFGCGADYLINNGAEACDVTIRCYLLPQVIDNVLDDLEDDFNNVHESEVV